MLNTTGVWSTLLETQVVVPLTKSNRIGQYQQHTGQLLQNNTSRTCQSPSPGHTAGDPGPTTGGHINSGRVLIYRAGDSVAGYSNIECRHEQPIRLQAQD